MRLGFRVWGTAAAEGADRDRVLAQVRVVKIENMCSKDRDLCSKNREFVQQTSRICVVKIHICVVKIEIRVVKIEGNARPTAATGGADRDRVSV